MKTDVCHPEFPCNEGGVRTGLNRQIVQEDALAGSEFGVTPLRCLGEQRIALFHRNSRGQDRYRYLVSVISALFSYVGAAGQPIQANARIDRLVPTALFRPSVQLVVADYYRAVLTHHIGLDKFTISLYNQTHTVNVRAQSMRKLSARNSLV